MMEKTPPPDEPMVAPMVVCESPRKHRLSPKSLRSFPAAGKPGLSRAGGGCLHGAMAWVRRFSDGLDREHTLIEDCPRRSALFAFPRAYSMISGRISGWISGLRGGLGAVRLTGLSVMSGKMR